MTRADAFVVLGATGHIGSVVARTLLREGHQIVAVVHDEAKAADLKSAGAEIAAVDLRDTQALRATLRRGRRAFLLNPPAPVTTDTNAEETRTATSIAEAVGGAGLEKVVVESTYGAQPGDAIGDLSVLWSFERAVGAAAIPMAINRGAYYYTNLDTLLDEARHGLITTMFPAQLKIPMVAPADLGLAAARRLAGPLDDVGVEYVEGPEAYTFDDVAAAFAKMLDHAVTVRTIERSEWVSSFRRVGYSERAAQAYARMTEVSLEGFDMPDDPIRGTKSVQEYISELVKERTSAG
ncbi:NmrA family NAD(P)-binding protein [Rhizobium sp. NZLR3b]|uniref:NmrA family NAD(P)-binding protein n=1 Tax=Rhizobium sp. NZLR3b TaxID=2731101 RepID=UPI001C8379E0|nr:NmrA family NAD(P)-binding protein [Rhizobium sp. NZLR3b]MBX5193711.1 NmrA family NAD(P)-binding protein [Rhizobium sp. NZLR3b]